MAVTLQEAGDRLRTPRSALFVVQLLKRFLLAPTWPTARRVAGRLSVGESAGRNGAGPGAQLRAAVEVLDELGTWKRRFDIAVTCILELLEKGLPARYRTDQYRCGGEARGGCGRLRAGHRFACGGEYALDCEHRADRRQLALWGRRPGGALQAGTALGRNCATSSLRGGRRWKTRRRSAAIRPGLRQRRPGERYRTALLLESLTAIQTQRGMRRAWQPPMRCPTLLRPDHLAEQGGLGGGVAELRAGG